MTLRDIFQKFENFEIKKISYWYGIIVLGVLGAVSIGIFVFSLIFFLPWFISVPVLLFFSAVTAITFSI